METTKGTSHRLAKLIAGAEIFRATVRAGLVPILGWAAVVLWSPSLGLGILLVALGLGPWRALRVARRHEWPGAGRALPLTGKRSRSCRAALWRRLALWGCLLIVLASASLLEARQAEQAKARTRVKVIAEVRLPHASRFALIRDPETGHLGLYKGGESIYSAENPLPLGKIVAMHDHGLVIALPSGRMIGIPRGARLPGARGLIFVRSALVDTLRFQVRFGATATPGGDYSVVDIKGRRAILERDSILGPEGATLTELVNRIPFTEVAPDTWEIPAREVKELGDQLGPHLVSATPIVTMLGGVGLTLSNSPGSGTLDRRGFEIQVGSLARRAGLKVGDRILFVNEEPVNSLGGLIRIYRKLKSDAALSQVKVVIQRGNELRTLTYRLR